MIIGKVDKVTTAKLHSKEILKSKGRQKTILKCQQMSVSIGETVTELGVELC